MNNKYNSPILAKPSGITLEQHELDVIAEGEALCSNFIVFKYSNIVNKCIADRLKLICKYHDEGKKVDKWQNACQKDYEEYKKNPGIFTAINIRNAGIRHELYSAIIAERLKMPLPLIAAIGAHHGKMNVANEYRWQEKFVSKIWKDLKRLAWKQMSLEETFRLQYEYSALRSLLQFADHRASAREERDYVPELKHFSYTFPHTKYRPVQQLIADNWKKDLLLLRAPTGAGKTDASLLWAQKQIENKRAERLVIAMPTRFTSNALSINVAESLSDTGLYHSSAWFSKYSQDIMRGIIEKDHAKKEHELARLLETPVTVCTIDHLLMSLTLTREDHHLITFNLANSCLVIDEADFYDQFTQANILVLLKALKAWKVPVLLMSASLPDTVIDDYRSIGFDVDNIIADHSDEERTRFEIKDICNYSDVNELESILELMREKGNGIIYANTIDKAFEFASWFMEHGYNDFLIYHSRFTEPDKQKKESSLIKALGRDAWSCKKAHGIAILTQIGEMSINISAEIMISDLCPIDRLMQRAGRLCRFNKDEIGDLFIVRPYKKGILYPAPYGTPPNKEYNTWKACDALVSTDNLLKMKKYNSKDLISLLNRVYDKETRFSVQAKENANHLEDYFRFNWLIGSREIIKDDDTSNQFWKSRDIPAQETVYVCEPENSHFKSWHAFQEFKIMNSIDISYYLAKDKGVFYTYLVTIGFERKEFSLKILREGIYSAEKGFVVSNSIFM